MTEKATEDQGAVGSPVEQPVRPDLHQALGDYWDAAYAEGQDDRNHDTEDGAAARALNAVYEAVAAMVAVERERLLALAKKIADREASAAAHHAGRWQVAHEHHMTRHAAMRYLIDALRA